MEPAETSLTKDILDRFKTITIEEVLDQFKGVMDRSIGIGSARLFNNGNRLCCTLSSDWSFRFFIDSGLFDYLDIIHAADGRLWTFSHSVLTDALNHLPDGGIMVEQMLMHAASNPPTPAAAPGTIVLDDPSHQEAIDIHPLPWNYSSLDCGEGEEPKFEINDNTNFVICLVDDEVVAKLIVDRVNSASAGA